MKKYILTLVLVWTVLQGYSQNSLSFYNLRSVAQSSYMNPALTPRQGFTLSLGDFNAQLTSPGVTLYDIFRSDETGNHAIERMIADNKINFRNIESNIEYNPLYLGLRIRRNYFSIGIQSNFLLSAGLPKDMLSLIYYGNANVAQTFGKPISMNDMSFESSGTYNFNFSYARDIGEKLSIGARVKFHYGIYHAKLLKNNTSILTDSSDNSSIRMRVASDYEFIGASEAVDVKSNIPGVSPNINFNSDYFSINNIFSKAAGTGVSFDLGLNYKFNKRFSVNAAVTDLGKMTWYKGNSFAKNSTFTYEGVLTDDPSKTDSLYKILADSVGKIFTPDATSKSYTTSFNTKIYTGFNWQLYNSGALGFLGLGEFYKDKFYIGGSVSFTQRIWKILDLRATYNKTRDLPAYVGGAVAVHLGPLTAYVATDNALGILDWHKSNMLNGRMGININIANRFDRDNDGVPNRKDKCRKDYGLRKYNGCPDTDNDLVPDNIDECKTVKGSTKTKGCPDKDGDGVKDLADSCVSVKGDSSLNGCPDKDGDRIPDYKDACPDVKGVAYLFGCPDTDGDSISDENDACPEVKGLRASNGCPDTDGDGVSDDKDACPNLFGDALNKGCPDSDGDGVTDNLDSCVTMKGLPQFNGCPDTDNDQVPDHIDNCPLEPGSIQKMGCPEIDTNAVILTPEEKKVINEAFSNLEFQSGTAQIAEKSLPSLVELAALLALRTAYNLEINGHTDNVGNAAKNLKLSQNRAVAVKDFIASKGVDYTRIKAKGFGSKKPIASNKTADGRQKNRRVEFKIVKSQS